MRCPIRYHRIGKFVGISGCHRKVFGKRLAHFPNSLAEGSHRTSFSDALRNKRGNLIQALLSDLFMNALISKNPHLPLQQGNEKQNACILSGVVKTVIIKRTDCPSPDGIRFPLPAYKQGLEPNPLSDEPLRGEKEMKLMGTKDQIDESKKRSQNK